MTDKVVRKISKTAICGIYQITNKINNKIYVGQSIDIERRWNQHKYGKGNIIVRNAIQKYGLDNFEFEILETIEFTTKNEVVNLLTELEQKWFDIKEPYINGYNINKTSKPNLTPNRDSNFGHKISKIKIDNNHCGKPVNQYSLKGEFIKKWKSAAEVERSLGFKAENISACCLKKQNSSNKFIWRFENDELLDIDIQKANKLLRLSEIRQYNLKGELIKKYKNIKEASKETNIKESIIRSAYNGKIKTGAGFIWKFKNEPLNLLDHIRNHPKIHQFNIDGELIKIWNSLREINRETQYSRYKIKKCCLNELSDYNGYKWRWVS